MNAVLSIETNPIEPSALQSRALKVLFYQFFPGGGSGIGRYTREVISRMARLPDIEPTLVCSPSCDWVECGEFAAWTGLREISHSHRWRRRLRFVIGQFVNPCRLFDYADEVDADIIHFSNINQVTYPFWRRRQQRSRAKVVVTIHDAFRMRGLVHPRYDNSQLAAFYRSADALLVHGQDQADALVARAGVSRDSIACVPHGPYDYGAPSAGRTELRARYGIPADRPVVLFFGKIRDDKNLDLFLQAVAESGTNTHVVIAGAPGRLERLTMDGYRNLAERIGLQDRVTWLCRFIDDREVPDLFMASDWVALPYSQSFTSPSGVLNVAASYRRPVLCSVTGTMGETLAACDIGVGVKPDCLEALTSGVQTLSRRIQDNDHFEFAEYFERYGWDANIALTRTRYQYIVGQ